LKIDENEFGNENFKLISSKMHQKGSIIKKELFISKELNSIDIYNKKKNENGEFNIKTYIKKKTLPFKLKDSPNSLLQESKFKKINEYVDSNNAKYQSNEHLFITNLDLNREKTQTLINEFKNLEKERKSDNYLPIRALIDEENASKIANYRIAKNIEAALNSYNQKLLFLH